MENNNGKKTALYLGAAVYLGVVLLSVALTMEFVTGILGAEEYLMRGVMSIGVVLVGLNSIAMPIALHFWAVDGTHRAAAIALYALDMAILAFNLITSFSTLMGNPPGWVQSYEPYSVAMFIFALATWGVLWILDPGEQAKVKLEKAKQAFKVRAVILAAEFMETAEGQDAIRAEAEKLIPQILAEASIAKQPIKSWKSQPVPPFGVPVAPPDTGYHAEAETVNPTLVKPEK